MRRSRLSMLALLGCLTVIAWSQKKPLDHTVYDGWRSIASPTLSNDGMWVAYGYQPQEGDRVNEVKSADGNKTYTFDRGGVFRFSGDSKFLVSTIVPKLADTKKATRDKVKPEDRPKNTLLILNLQSGQKTEIEKVASFTMAEQDAGWLIYRPEPPKAEPTKPAETKPDEKKDDKPKKKADHKPGDVYVLRNIGTGVETKLDDVVSVRFNKAGTQLLITRSTKDGAGDGIFMRDLGSGKEAEIVKGMGRYSKIAATDDFGVIAYATDKDDYAAKSPVLAIYSWSKGKSFMVAKEGSDGMQQGWVVAPAGSFTLSESGKRLTFGTIPKPVEEKKDDTPEDEKVSLDVWNWQDKMLQPQQLLMAASEKARTYDAIAFLETGRVVQLEGPDLRQVSTPTKYDIDYGIASDNRPYQREQSWGVSKADHYLVHLNDGKRQGLIQAFEGNVSLSPTGRYIVISNDVAKDISVARLPDLKQTSISAGIPNSLYDELDDHPDFPPLYGFAGWTKDDKRVLLYDRYDIWASDPSGTAKPVRLTFGRESHRIYRIVRTDPDEEFIGDTFLCSVTDDDTKASGLTRFSRPLNNKTTVDADATLIWGDKRYSWVGKSKNADRVLITAQTFVEYPNLMLTNTNLESPKAITDANPQQKDYNWGTAELVSWRSNDGVELQGILVKPENFEYGKKYPMIAYFYERDSDTLHQYRPPAPSASTINVSMYASQGYLVFIPDIPYKIGYPGESAISAITAGCNNIIARGYVDPKRVGIQGQSWGGYQVAYMVTETDMFAAACAGAPVSNMFSAYNGIRWGSGLTRQFQYEKTQSRIGGTMWENPMRYFENSPVFHADKIKTPLLIMHNDKDGSVPWWQGIEMFNAMRRLDKPAWMCVYNEEDHNLIQRKNRKDWSVRMQQFFDHFLKGAPMPKWMSEGVPAVDKGKDYGFALPKRGGN
ncbi:MAG: prolyl oligopeptidase family serine peptidase [Fimbriimonadaceae bacterium]